MVSCFDQMVISGPLRLSSLWLWRVGEPKGCLKMAAEQRARACNPLQGQQEAMLRPLIKYLHNSERNINLAFVTEWMGVWKCQKGGF